MNATNLRNSLKAITQGLNHLLWPAACINCRSQIAETDKHLCSDCWSGLLQCTSGYYCRRCGKDTTEYALVNNCCPDCQGLELHFDGIARTGIYAQALQQMILAFKTGRTEHADVLGALARTVFEAAEFYPHIDLLVPVPLYWFRRFRRGYNQSMLIVQKLNHHARINTDLVRIRNTESQVAMTSPAKRVKNVTGAFAVRSGHRFAGKTICLVDDIKTTGATLNECAKVLKEAGAAKVYALVLAVAGQYKD